MGTSEYNRQYYLKNRERILANYKKRPRVSEDHKKNKEIEYKKRRDRKYKQKRKHYTDNNALLLDIQKMFNYNIDEY